MIKISKLADYAVVILVSFDGHEEKRSAIAVAQAAHLPEPTVAKVLKLLAKGGVVESIRGAGGGYKLAKPAKQISLAEIIVAVDGPIALTACVDSSHDNCDFEAACPVKGRWNFVNRAVQEALDSISLADMITADFVPPAKPGGFDTQPANTPAFAGNIEERHS